MKDICIGQARTDADDINLHDLMSRREGRQDKGGKGEERMMLQTINVS